MVPPRHPVNVPRRRAGARAALLAAPLLLAACGGTNPADRTALDRIFGPVPEMRGNRVEADVLREITPGVQTRADVQALLGSPSATSTFANDRWFYISAVSRNRIGRVPGISDQRVVEITFNPQGVVQGVRELGPNDGRDVAVVERTTPVPGNDRSFLQALFGNIGRIGPTGTAAQAGPGVGPTSN